MSKEKVFELFSKAAKDRQLQEKLKAVLHSEELVALGQREGLEFSSEDFCEALAELQNQPPFLSQLVKAVLRVFSPSDDNYPEIGVQPFSGEPNPNQD
jgi:predicted ribosomally synthesized peptide with nif11-like leader